MSKKKKESVKKIGWPKSNGSCTIYQSKLANINQLQRQEDSAENGLSALQFSMSEGMNILLIDFFGVKKDYLAPNMLKKIIFPSLKVVVEGIGEHKI